MKIVNLLKKNRIDVPGLRISWAIQRRRKPIAKTGFDGNRADAYKLHLGPGANWVKPSDDWLSVDIDPDRGDIVLDFHTFEGFPLPDDSVDAIYASHTFEHISIYRILKVMSECHRVLRKNGILRVIVPDPQISIRHYVENNHDFELFARRKARAKEHRDMDLTLFECLKGDFISPNHQPELLGEKLAHQNAWDFESMQADLKRAGFEETNITRRGFQEIGSDDFAFEGTYPSEANEFERSLYVEARK